MDKFHKLLLLKLKLNCPKTAQSFPLHGSLPITQQIDIIYTGEFRVFMLSRFLLWLSILFRLDEEDLPDGYSKTWACSITRGGFWQRLDENVEMSEPLTEGGSTKLTATITNIDNTKGNLSFALAWNSKCADIFC
jgi:hypothetical protein